MWRHSRLAVSIAVFVSSSVFGGDAAKPLKAKPGVSGDRTEPNKPDRLTSSEDAQPDSAVIPPLKQHFEYVLPGTCVSAISAGPDFKCTGRDKDHLVCSGMVVTVRGKVDDCLQINVVKDSK